MYKLNNLLLQMQFIKSTGLATKGVLDAFMKHSIVNAENSIKENDVIKMMACYALLKDYEL